MTNTPAVIEHSTQPSHTRRNAALISVIAAIWFLQWARDFVIPLTIGVFVTFWLTPLVKRLARWKIPRAVGAALVLITLMAGVGGAGYALRDDARALLSGLPKAAVQMNTVINRAMRERGSLLQNIRNTMLHFNSGAPAPVNAPTVASSPADFQSVVLHGSMSAMAAIVDVGVVLFLVYFLLLSGDAFKRKLLIAISGRMAQQRVTVRILNEIGTQLQRYLGVMAITNAIVGLLTGLVFWGMGVERAAVWGVGAAVLHVIPYLGPAMVAGASGLAASIQFQSVSHGAMVGGASIVISTLVGMFLTTWLASRASHMNSAAVFIGLLFWGWLWGIAGLLLGTPIMMAIKVIAAEVPALHWVGTFLSDSSRRRKGPESPHLVAIPPLPPR